MAVIETDKVNVDIRSTHSGVIKQYYANEGDTVQVDANFFEIDTEAKGSAGAGQAKPQKQEQAAPKKVISKIIIIIKEEKPAEAKKEAPKQEAPK